MAETLLSEENVITLEPFIHQVGGRSTILVFNETICKPINSRELTFYETLPQELKPFVPEFRGLIEVEFCENSDGYLIITAKPVSNSYKSDTNSQQRTKYRIKLCKPNGDILIENNDTSVPYVENNHIFEDGSVLNIGKKLPKEAYDSKTKIHNPWVLRTISSLKESDNHKRRKFLLLENLTARFRYPCIMDLKMGTRQYDDNADETKIKSHTLKVAKTTSGAMGLRITGVQVYNKVLDRFICHNKYYGRTLTPEGLVDSFKTFLQIENSSKADLIPLLIEKLEKLLSVVKRLDTFRFYTSSLLILYEGNVDRFDSNLVDIRMIDFAHSTHQFMPEDNSENTGPDVGYIFGLNNLISLLKSIRSEYCQSIYDFQTK